MYLEAKMPEPAEYQTVVNYIDWWLEKEGLTANQWAAMQEDKFVSAQTLYNILKGKHKANYDLLYKIATRMGAEISLSISFPPEIKKV